MPFKIFGQFQMEIRKEPNLMVSFIFYLPRTNPYAPIFASQSILWMGFALGPEPSLLYTFCSVRASSPPCSHSLSGGQDLCFSSLCPLQFHGNTLNISCRARCYRRGSHPTCQQHYGFGSFFTSPNHPPLTTTPPPATPGVLKTLTFYTQT